MSDPLESALRRLARVLERAGVPYAFIGGVAVNAWAQPRATFDLDVLVQASAEGEARLARRLRLAGFLPWAPPPQAKVRLPIWSLVFGEGRDRTFIDLFVAGDEYQFSALSRRRAIPIGGGSIAVLSPEDLLLHKLVAGRTRDMADVESLLEAMGPKLDRHYLRRWARRLKVALPPGLGAQKKTLP
ncbi:MAG: nucleotidyltransferase family protein [Elusimicrobia bacterium]|nr:nucleotidyltransferase family protein [Elusimicrobiota bacterium]